MKTGQGKTWFLELKESSQTYSCDEWTKWKYQ